MLDFFDFVDVAIMLSFSLSCAPCCLGGGLLMLSVRLLDREGRKTDVAWRLGDHFCMIELILPLLNYSFHTFASPSSRS